MKQWLFGLKAFWGLLVGSQSMMAANLSTNLINAELEQGIGVYSDNHERSRHRFSLATEAGFSHQGLLTGTSYSLRGFRDRIHEKTLPYDVSVPPQSTSSGASLSENDEYVVSTVVMGAAQTWNKLTETRQSFSYSQSDRDDARGGSVGISQWFYRESLRASLDYSRQDARKPVIEFLDFDQEIVSVPADTLTDAVDGSLRHLATPTTMIDYKMGWTDISNRPDAWRYGVSMRQFVPVAKAAVHADATRYRNYGQVTTETTFGSLDAWEANLSWLQTLWTNAEGMLSYRYYREDEITRALGDELTFGSDTVSAAFSQRISLFDGGRRRPEYRVIVRGSRYLANSNAGSELHAARLKAGVFEMGLSAAL